MSNIIFAYSENNVNVQGQHTLCASKECFSAKFVLSVLILCFRASLYKVK